MYKPVPAPDNTEMCAIKHIFLEPFQTYVRHSDGTNVLTGYGIGETINILEPRIQLLIARSEVMTEVELDDGSVLTNIPHGLKLKRVWGDEGNWTGK